MDVRLVVVSGKSKVQELQVTLPVVIGRGREATAQVAHPLISRRHCELYESDGYAVVHDMGSLNGTFVNDQRVTQAVVPPGELLTLGTLTFRVEYQPSAAAPPPAAAPGGPDQHQDLDDFEFMEFDDNETEL